MSDEQPKESEQTPPSAGDAGSAQPGTAATDPAGGAATTSTPAALSEKEQSNISGRATDDRLGDIRRERTSALERELGVGVAKKERQHMPVSSPVAPDNLAEDVTKLRRLQAEDEEYSLANVPMLIDLCLQSIIDNFEYNSSVLNELNRKQKQFVLKKLPTNLPWKLTANLITYDDYWKRCCRAAWKVSDVRDYGGDHRRMFFERKLVELIENFVPNTTDLKAINDLLAISAPFVRALRIGQLLPPVLIPNQSLTKEATTAAPDDDIGSEGEEEVEEDMRVDHFDLNNVVPFLPTLEELSITFSVRDCGMNFEWGFFQFTQRDTVALAECVRACTSLKKFSLHHSRVDDEKIRVVISHMLNHPNIADIDFSHNLISDRGARAVGKLLNGNSVITRCNLCNNQIGYRGAQALAHALTKHSILTHLNLRLNRLGDDGGQAVAKSLMQNATLIELNLATNQLTEPTAAILSHTIQSNSTLKKLDLSCNRLGVESGKQLKDALDNNKTIEWLDLRLTEVGQDAEYCIEQILLRNRGQLSKEQLALRTMSRPVSTRGGTQIEHEAIENATSNAVAAVAQESAADASEAPEAAPDQTQSVAPPVEAAA